jgi:nucleoside-diphosphate-sugar epimerase
VVTGGCGFIGVNVGRHLAAAGYRTVAFDDFSTGRPEDARAAGFDDVVHGDIRDADAGRHGPGRRWCTGRPHGVIGSVQTPATTRT